MKSSPWKNFLFQSQNNTLAVRGDKTPFYKWLYCLKLFADMRTATQKAAECLTNSI